MKHNALLIATFLSLVLPGLASPITIANANFNAQTVGANSFALGVQNWTEETGGTAPVTSTETTPFPIANLPPGGGPNVAILGDFNGGFGYIFQVLPTAWAPNTTYTLSFYAGDPAGLTYNGYLVTLDAGSTVLATDNTGITGIAAGRWAQDTLTFATGAVAPSGDITIELGTTPAAGGAGFDLITLNAVANIQSSAPEPGAWIMAASGLSLLSAAKLRRLTR